MEEWKDGKRQSSILPTFQSSSRFTFHVSRITHHVSRNMQYDYA